MKMFPSATPGIAVLRNIDLEIHPARRLRSLAPAAPVKPRFAALLPRFYDLMTRAASPSMTIDIRI
jgi:hypothetical protein